MKKDIDYEIVNIHTNTRFPGEVYAKVRGGPDNAIYVNATLDYCCQWIKRNLPSKHGD